MDPRELLPPEIWQLVFDKVEDPQDWLNLYRSSPYFEGVVGERRTTSLFPQVIPHVMDYLGSDVGDILGLRMVSRPWKAAVDEMLESRVHKQLYRLEESYIFTNSARISSFHQRFGETYSGGNPFVGRFVSLTHATGLSSEAVAEYNNLATRLLERFGIHIKSLRVRVHDASFANVAARLESWLQLVPNLESLELIICKYGVPDDGGEGDGALRRPSSAIGGLLPNLKCISFHMRYLGDPDRRGMLDLWNTVVRLACSNPNSLIRVETTGVSSALLPLPNVKSAEVLLDSVEDYSNLASTSWPLSKLTVDRIFNVPLDPLFECVERFKDTLTSLQLRAKIPESLLRRKLDLPHLKALTIQEHPSMSLQFLTKLENLEALSIHHNGSSTNHDYESIRKYKFIELVKREVVRWGLWEVLPKLTKISLPGVCILERNGAF